MQTIKFSHFYKKMPAGIQFLNTWIKDIALIDYEKLSQEDIKKDTETVDGKYYKLPQTHLIWIKLYTATLVEGVEWGTLRRYTPSKYEYYKGLLGQQVKIEIDEK